VLGVSRFVTVASGTIGGGIRIVPAFREGSKKPAVPLKALGGQPDDLGCPGTSCVQF